MFNLSLIPFLAYWLAVAFCSLFNSGKSLELDSKQDFNTVSPKKVFWSVLSLTLSATLGNCLLLYFNIISKDVLRWYYILIGIWWVDTIEYATHYAMHKIPFLYQKFHKEHHRLNNTYSYGALYNNNFEATLTSGMMVVGFYLLGISFPEFIIVTSLANIATVLDHSSEFLTYKKGFHHLHHSKFQRSNYQQPFFTYYDRIFGTYKVEN